jgi:uncharacterized protein YpiB (UPF0302 family)
VTSYGPLSLEEYYRFANIVGAIEFKLCPQNLSVRAEGHGAQPSVRVYMRVQHRETGEYVTVQEVHTIAAFEARLPESEIIKLVRSFAQKLWLHELDEMLHFRDERIFDPHVKSA